MGRGGATLSEGQRWMISSEALATVRPPVGGPLGRGEGRSVPDRFSRPVRWLSACGTYHISASNGDACTEAALFSGRGRARDPHLHTRAVATTTTYAPPSDDLDRISTALGRPRLEIHRP